MENHNIGKFIATMRKEKGLTQKELGDKLFVTDKAVSKWERGLSLPDITILESLASILGVEVSEILQGKNDKNNNINVTEEVNKILANIKKEQDEKNKKTKKICIISSIITLVLIFIIFLITSYYNSYHPNKIIIGENNYIISSSTLEDNGLEELKEIVEKSENATINYNVSYFESTIDKKSSIKSFTLSINFFDDNLNYVGRGSYIYKNKNLIYNYTSINDEKTLLVEYYSKNSNIDYISDQIKKIPLKQQLKISDLKNYVISYRPNTTLKYGTPIFDCQDNKEIPVLNSVDYNNLKGGESKDDIYFVIRLNDGSSIVSGQQYLYVFDFIDEEVPKNPNYMMETDYYINNGTLKFTRDYGSSWINADISEEQIKETLDFYGDISFTPNSWFISTNELIPIAYFYGKEPTLKITNDNGKTWTKNTFITSSYVDGKQITKRIVGFTSQNFGYVALGTDWTMGSGEYKKLYFTYDGGINWNEIEVPLNGTSHVLFDICMYDEMVGVMTLRDSINSNFPIIYSTISGGKAWNEVKYREANLPDDITYLSDIDSITKNGEEYYITLGQGNDGTLKATFRANDMINWLYSSKTNSNIHTVG